jgi:hypothetical protein
MMRVQNYGVTLHTTQAATLASVVVAHEDGCAPLRIFDLTPRYVVLARFVDMILPLGLIGLFVGNTTRCIRYRLSRASVGTEFSLTAFFFILRHGLSALWTPHSYHHASVANTPNIRFALRFESFATDKACFADAPRIACYMTCASDAGGALARFGVNCDRGRGLAAIGTRRGALRHTIIADWVRRLLTTDATVLHATHIAIIPQVAWLEKSDAL